MTQSTYSAEAVSPEPAPSSPPMVVPPASAPRAASPWRGRVVTGVLCLAVGVGLGVAFGPREPTEAIVPAAAADERTIELPEGIARSAGIEVSTVGVEEISPQLDLPGTVQFDEGRVADVGGRVEGRVTRILVRVGDAVTEGEPVAQIDSPSLGEGMADLFAARARLAAATTHATREESLRQRQLTTANVVETARASAEVLEAEVRGAEHRLLAMGVTQGELDRVERGQAPVRWITLRSPIAGEVIEQFAHVGQVIASTAPVLRVADISSLWVTLEVYESDLARVGLDDAAQILSEAYPEHQFDGTVSHLDAVVDARTRTAGVRVVVDNAGRRLRPGHFVHAFLTTSGERRRGLLVPRAAVVQVDGQPTVFLARGGRRFEPRAVELGQTLGERVEVTSGLDPGVDVVTSGAFALKSEMQR